MYPETFETSLQLGQSVLEGFSTSDVDITAIKSEVRGDYGLNEVFQEYDELFKENIRPPGHVINAQSEAKLAEKNAGTAVKDGYETATPQSRSEGNGAEYVSSPSGSNEESKKAS